jgi:hypothetical protein
MTTFEHKTIKVFEGTIKHEIVVGSINSKIQKVQ